ncbi:MAG: BamA/TamA family outer membrane protein, partial [Chitinophagaceae bacterium]
IGRFRGPSYFYLESEYRFPISRNKLFSGVAFVNFQSASDGKDINLFDQLEPAAGAGLRVLFNKKSRTNICIDYAFGIQGSHGLFFGLNEVF